MKVRFGPFGLDTESQELTRAGARLHLSPKAFALLSMLLERRPAVVDKAALRQRLWPDVHVVETSLTNLVAEIRSALGESQADAPPATPLLRTVHGVGYAFAGEAVDIDAKDSLTHAAGTAVAPRAGDALRAVDAPRAAPFWVVWKERPIVLAPGDNVIGRDAACAVWIDAGGVSRRHACIRVPADGAAGAGTAGATIDDLDSTNGTYVGGRRVTKGRRLENGDRIRIGGATLVFRAGRDADAPTKRVRPPRARR